MLSARTSIHIAVALALAAVALAANMFLDSKHFAILQLAVFLWVLEIGISNYIMAGATKQQMQENGDQVRRKLQELDAQVQLLVIDPETNASLRRLPGIVRGAIRHCLPRLEFGPNGLKIRGWHDSKKWYSELWELLAQEQARLGEGQRMIVRITQNAAAAVDPAGPWRDQYVVDTILNPQRNFCDQGGIIIRIFVGRPMEDKKEDELSNLIELMRNDYRIGALRLKTFERQQNQKDFLWIQHPQGLIVTWQYEFGYAVSNSEVRFAADDLHHFRADWRDYSSVANEIGQQEIGLSDDQWRALRAVGPFL